ncbi:universal stress protein [Georgenia sp. EYE_87]|uniref:universal stress protein n=1 Tax=Georgenia sp. EYE_87 TaxID=2853448 RepID=UPI0020049A66|nr:universal stress protein [Georgenia sp. EYE_87]MCK6210161.1 universal stress protein [Georgenia sp. EYE_87]
MAAELQVPSGAVVVGVDGSDRSVRAVSWAAKEAARRGAPLHLVYAFEWPALAEGYDPVPPDELLQPGDRMVEKHVSRVREAHPDLAVSGQAVLGRPSVVLVDASRRASVVVVGARGLGRFTGPLLGSVSQKVAAHAQGPVVVVRQQVDDLPGPVVVGADPEDPPREALTYAFEEARRRGSGVTVVAVSRQVPFRVEYPEPALVTMARQVERAEQHLRAVVDEIAAEHDGVPVEVRLSGAHPVDAIVEAAGTESLVVVGSRGHGGLASVMLGSVSRGVIHRAPVVAVVRVHHQPVLEESA